MRSSTTYIVSRPAVRIGLDESLIVWTVFFFVAFPQLQEARRVMSAILLATFVALCRSAVLVVNSMGTNTNFTTIQAAINSASCGFVFVVVQLCVCVKRRTALRCGARVRSHKRSPFSLTRLIKPCCWLACSRSRAVQMSATQCALTTASTTKVRLSSAARTRRRRRSCSD